MRCCTLFCLILTICCTVPVFGIQKVERQAPDIFARELEPLLTPIEEIFDGRSAFPKAEEGGIILLSERIDFIDADGTRYRARQVAYYVNEESGIESIERDVFSFDKERMRVFLKRAFSMDKSGNIKELDDDAAFIHSPQEGADNSLYTSDEELVLVYPGVEKGVLVSAIVYYVVDEPVIADQLVSYMTFRSSWPIYRKRYVFDMPDDWRQRLNIVKSGTGAPNPKVTHPEKGRSRLEWKIRKKDAWTYESRAPEWQFNVPAVWISTLSGWDDISSWYHKLSQDRDIPREDLKEAVDTATDGLTERNDIIQALTTLASDSVRYTGLEFGMASYKPYDCNDVWHNGYGDCKDKANLLASILRYKGIEAWTALLKTDGHGRIEKRSPGWNQFNHAIVAVPEPQGSFLLIDPTVEHLVPGLLPVGDMERPVLVLTDKGAVWTQSSFMEKTGYLMDFDLDLSNSGKLSGWCTITDYNSSAAFETDSYNKRKPDSRIDYAQDIIDNYIPGIRAYDVDYEERAGPVDEVSLRAYFETEGQTDSAESIAFPYPISYLPEFPARDREYPYIADAFSRQVIARIDLPRKKTISSLPEPFSAENNCISIEASWSVDETGDLIARFDWIPKKTILSPSEYESYKRAVFSAGAWLKQPMLLVDSSDETGSSADETEYDIDFPTLATGKGQLRLLDDRFPDKDERRRKALNKVIQWFPDDPQTLADAKVKRILIDWPGTPENASQCVAEFEEILNLHGDQIDRQTWAWIKYLEARSRITGDNDKDQGVQDLEALLEDESLSAFRRGWSGYFAALGCRDDDTAHSIGLLDQVRNFDSDALQDADRLLLEILFERENLDPVRTLLMDVLSRGESSDATFGILLQDLQKMLDDSPESRAREMVRMVEEVCQDQMSRPAIKEAFEGLSANLDTRLAQSDLAKAYRLTIEGLDQDWWFPEHEARSQDMDKLYDAIEDANGQTGLNLSTHYLLRGSEVSFDNFILVLFYHAWWLNSLAPAGREALLDTLESYIFKFSLDEEQFLPRIAGKMARIWFSMGNPDRAISLLESARNIPNLKDWAMVDLNRLLITLNLSRGLEAAVMETAAESREILSSNKYGTDIAMVELSVHLANCETEDALKALGRLKSLNDEWIGDAEYSVMTKLLMNEAFTTAVAEKYWEQGSGWWDDWKDLCGEYQASPFSLSNILKLRNPEDWTSNINASVKTGNKKEYLEELGVIVLASRMCPVAMIDVRDAIANSSQISADFFAAVRQFFLSATKDWAFGDEATRNAILLARSAHLYDAGEIPEAAKLSQDLYKSTGPGEEVGISALRVWLLAERDSKSKVAAIREASSVLESGLEISARVALIKNLSDSYYVRKDYAAQNKLFQREEAFLKEANKSVLNMLQERLGEEFKADSLSLLMEEWIQAHCKEWFDATWPSSYEDAGINQDDNIYASLPGTGAQVKMSLIASMNDAKPLAEREQAAWMAMSFYGSNLVPPDEFLNYVTDTLSSWNFPQGVKAPFWYMAVSTFVDREDPDSIETLLDKEYVVGVNPEFVTNTRKMRKFLQAFQSSSGNKLVDCIKHLDGLTLDMVSEQLVSRLISRLVYLDQSEDAREVLKETKLFVARPDVNLAALRLKWTQEFKDAVQRHSFNKVFREMIEETVGSFPKKEPEAFKWFNPVSTGCWLDNEQSKECSLYALATGRFKGAVPEDVFSGLVDDTNNNELSLLSIKLLQEALALDSTPELTVQRFFSLWMADVDQIDHRTAFESVLQAELDKPDLDELVRKVCNMGLIFSAIRTSDEEFPDSLFGDDAVSLSSIEKERLLYLLNRNNTDKLLEQVNKYVLEDGITPDGYFACFLAYETLGLDLEAEIAEEALLEEISKHLKSDSLVEDMENWIRFPVYCWHLNKQDALPDYSIYRVIEKCPTAHARDSARLGFLLYEENWTGLLELSSALIERSPDLYDTYGFQAMALANLGQVDEANKAMNVFRKYCRDKVYYTAFLRVFDTLTLGHQNH